MAMLTVYVRGVPVAGITSITFPNRWLGLPSLVEEVLSPRSNPFRWVLLDCDFLELRLSFSSSLERVLREVMVFFRAWLATLPTLVTMGFVCASVAASFDSIRNGLEPSSPVSCAFVLARGAPLEPDEWFAFASASWDPSSLGSRFAFCCCLRAALFCFFTDLVSRGRTPPLSAIRSRFNRLPSSFRSFRDWMRSVSSDMTLFFWLFNTTLCLCVCVLSFFVCN
mmetsp:Transcript_10738/g.13103  ORF Transcript_10738/g.13103 Transcript_10738/m.13103 type:complete len:224 (+) Transcript_10738:91-762(+)